MWVVRRTTRGTAALPLLHQHDTRWAESYKKDNSLFCCQCGEEYPHPDFAFASDVTPRRDDSVYQTFDSRFIFVDTRVQTRPTGDLRRWGPYGHSHLTQAKAAREPEIVACDLIPILYRERTVCPDCLEEAPNAEAYKALQEERGVAEPVKCLTCPFSQVVRIEREGGEVQFLRYARQLQ